MTPLDLRLAELPRVPGVYLMKNEDGAILYIGKAKNLKNRVMSYFRDTTARLSHRAAALIQDKIDTIDWIITDSELEALILEAQLIQTHNPKYNVRLKDDKHYPYICVTTKEPYPRIKVVRKILKDGNSYFGPYSDVGAMRRVIDLIPKLFQLRTCSFELPLKDPIRPCLNYHIQKCQAPCANLCTQQEYGYAIHEILLLLEGRTKTVVKEFKQKMELAVSEKRFERAAHYRDNIIALEATTRKQLIEIGDTNACFDAIAVVHENDSATVVIMEYRDGLLIERKNYDLECRLEQEYSEIISEFILGYYICKEQIPKELYIEQEVDDSELLENFLSGVRESKVTLHVPQKGEKKRVMSLARKNAYMLFIELKARKEKEKNIDNAVGLLQNELSLVTLPLHIIGFDISHLGGTNTVASMVDFKNGRPDKKSYKKFNVKSVVGIDDFASMHEVVGRAVKRIAEGTLARPDLIVVDGGKGQLSSAYSILLEYQLQEIPIIGLAKRLEEVFIPNQSEPILINYNSPALKLLQWIRDETHRFAITFQRSKRTKELKRNWLDGIEGVGDITKEKIYSLYTTQKELLAAPLEDLEKYVGKTRAQKIVDILSSNRPESIT